MSQPIPPDGSDPRIVTPAEDEPEVLITHGYSTGKTYHTATCPIVKRMNEPQEVPLSVAEWKDYTKCRRCDKHEGDDGYDHPSKAPRDGANIGQLLSGVDAIACLQIRALLLSGSSQSEVAETVDAGASTVGRHGRGKCECNHYGRSLAWDGGSYAPVDEEGVPKHITGYAPIDSETCATMRRAVVREGVTAGLLSTVLDVSDGSVRHHARGRCDHDHGVRPAEWDYDANEWVCA